ncbi:MAG: hypothetical protein ACI9IP_003218 [Arcticibacterium sp.]|jgi:hypothetical protein
MKNTTITLLLKFSFFTAFGQTDSPLEHRVFDPDLKTVQLYTFGDGTLPAGMSSQVLTLNGSSEMVLEFDDLRASYRQFHVKIQHCNLDWTPSRLRDLEYLNDYNDFIINDYEISQNTKIAYFHYGFVLPRIKVSGNYALLLYENSLSENPVASLRFRALENRVGVSAQVIRAQDPALWQTHQQVDFELTYGDYDIRDPRNDFKIIIRQNFNENLVKTGFRASSLNGGKRTVSFHFFENENVFSAVNEFRSIDLRSNFNRGINVAEIQQGIEDNVWLVPQTIRSNKTYLEAADLNGRYLIETLDGDESSLNADYMHVHTGFKLEPLPQSKKICLMGGFNGFNCHELVYNEAFGGYESTLLLKQGIYDFQFGIRDTYGNTETSSLEGDFSSTGNTYEVFVYHKPPASRSELLVGYAMMNQ